jgi:hypothetical protein
MGYLLGSQSWPSSGINWRETELYAILEDLLAHPFGSAGRYIAIATTNQHPPVHHRLDARYYSLVDELQPS